MIIEEDELYVLFPTPFIAINRNLYSTHGDKTSSVFVTHAPFSIALKCVQVPGLKAVAYSINIFLMGLLLFLPGDQVIFTRFLVMSTKPDVGRRIGRAWIRVEISG